MCVCVLSGPGSRLRTPTSQSLRGPRAAPLRNRTAVAHTAHTRSCPRSKAQVRRRVQRRRKAPPHTAARRELRGGKGAPRRAAGAAAVVSDVRHPPHPRPHAAAAVCAAPLPRRNVFPSRFRPPLTPRFRTPPSHPAHACCGRGCAALRARSAALRSVPAPSARLLRRGGRPRPHTGARSECRRLLALVPRRRQALAAIGFFFSMFVKEKDILITHGRSEHDKDAHLVSRYCGALRRAFISSSAGASELPLLGF